MLHKTEADLAKIVLGFFKKHGFEVHPEHRGWDIVAVKKGRIIGIETKLVHNAKAYKQAALRNDVHYKIVAAQDCNFDAGNAAFQRRVINIYVEGTEIRLPEGLSKNLRHFRHRPEQLLWLPLFCRASVKPGTPNPTAVSKKAQGALVFERVMRHLSPTVRSAIMCHQELIPYRRWVDEYIERFTCPDGSGKRALAIGQYPSENHRIYRKVGTNKTEARQHTRNLTEGQVMAEMLKKRRETETK